ncbi:hypothetical protein N7T98_26390, partial [Pseudomonas syringae pv. tomato]|uniref:hypothetical protein n=1 Tax=Pseudomonas syringae group genomosp. 3 TaxID=251701 RepID=UPI0022A71374
RPTCKAEDERYNENTNQCEYKIDNSHWVGKSLEYECNEGYVLLINGLCEQKAECEHWNSENNTCFEKPAHSHWLYSEGSTWECDDGYYKTYFDKCETTNPIDLTNYI